MAGLREGGNEPLGSLKAKSVAANKLVMPSHLHYAPVHIKRCPARRLKQALDPVIQTDETACNTSLMSNLKTTLLAYASL
ncbi:hypothetical protein ANN_15448 [Periplaneta americana]|uniref:Uncharacterized protein n=1 Tax=Periplaneta americana TaxID=6978 RepID=A0ABQ8SHL9_PERAM|nr:hypothetical protein ANN_15448 [Periplaneta americana]